MSDFTLDDLETIIARRATSDDEMSYTRKLVGKGMGVCAKKLGEEAVETVIAAAAGKTNEVVTESADVLYHLLVLWAAAGVKPADVYETLAAREGRSGLEEKASRS